MRNAFGIKAVSRPEVALVADHVREQVLEAKSAEGLERHRRFSADLGDGAAQTSSDHMFFEGEHVSALVDGGADSFHVERLNRVHVHDADTYPLTPERVLGRERSR